MIPNRTSRILPTPPPLANRPTTTASNASGPVNRHRKHKSSASRIDTGAFARRSGVKKRPERRTTPSTPNSQLLTPISSIDEDTQDESDDSQLALSPAIKASHSDPFNSWPIACYRDLDENFNFLVNSFGPSTFGYAPNDQGFDLFKPMARLTLSDPAAFHALMIAPVIRKGELTGQSLPGMNALWHQMEALRIIKERIESGDMEQCTTEGSIYAVMVLMGIAATWNAIGPDEFDPAALNKLILSKGGLNEISKSHPVLEMSIYGMSVMTPGILRSDLYRVNDLNISVDGKQDVKVLLYSLLGFIRGTVDLQRRTSMGLTNVRAAFAAGTPARALFREAPNHPGIYAQKQKLIRRRLMLHTMMYIFCILQYAPPNIIQEFTIHLQFCLGNSKFWRNSLKMFDWCIGINVSRATLMFPEQAWQSYELLCAIECLDEQLQDDVLAFYTSLLAPDTGPVCRPEDLARRISSSIFSK